VPGAAPCQCQAPGGLETGAGQLLHPHVVGVVEQPAQLAGHRVGLALADGSELVHDFAPSIVAGLLVKAQRRAAQLGACREVTVLRTGQMTDSLPVSTAGVTGLSQPTDAMVAAPA